MDLIQKVNAEEIKLPHLQSSYSGHLQNFIQLQVLSCKQYLSYHDLG